MAACLLAVPLLCLLLTVTSYASGQTDTCIAGQSKQANFQKKGLQHVVGSSFGRQVIIPGIKFICYGYITNWSAIAVVDKRFLALSHVIHFQTWRRVGKTRYHRVGNDYLLFPPNELNNIVTSTTDSNIGYFEFQQKMGEGENRIYFQPGDVVGFFIAPVGASSLAPLGIAFINATFSDNTSDVVDMYDYSISEHAQLCEVSECAQTVTKHDAVIPQIFVNFVTTTPDVPTPHPTAQRDCTVLSVGTCYSSPSPVAETPSTSTESHKVPRLAWIVGATFSASIVICGVAIIFLAGYLVRQRRRNPTYTLNSNLQQSYDTASNIHLSADHELVIGNRMANSSSISIPGFEACGTVQAERDISHQWKSFADKQSELYTITTLQYLSDAQNKQVTEL